MLAATHPFLSAAPFTPQPASPAHPALETAMEMPTGDKPISQKPVITPLRFVEMVNARLRTHPLYREGMEVYAIPRHSDQPRSMVCAGPRGAIGVCNTVVTIVRGEYDVVPDIDEEWHHRTADPWLSAPPPDRDPMYRAGLTRHAAGSGARHSGPA